MFSYQHANIATFVCGVLSEVIAAVNALFKFSVAADDIGVTQIVEQKTLILVPVHLMLQSDPSSICSLNACHLGGVMELVLVLLMHSSLLY
ncbi:hypothetical protein TNCT_373871 [Trichonephila clavata]|uniref:Uncharacterized protein n=1 Tax=Trichonephila clavata TaxID=2740835 RepID=A0A8X6FKB8_TRICU|nr:hypothetical protein TNCT_373871 [Trichonephila clavata]